MSISQPTDGHETGTESDHRAAARRGLMPPVQWAWWIIAVSLAVIALEEVRRAPTGLLPSALGQSITAGGARGTFAFTGQLTRNTFGVFMVDVDAMTLWCYEYKDGKLRLAAARDWTFDRYLRNQNNLDPLPDEVERLVDQERAARKQSAELQNP